MSIEAARLLTLKDLAERWGCATATALDRVREKGVPYVWLGPGDARLTERGQKFIRFRPRAVEDWEAGQEATWKGAAPTPTPKRPKGAGPRPAATGTDGVSRLGGGKRPGRSA